MNIDDVKDLTFYMGDKNEGELWDIVKEACRVSTPAWRAWEKLHGNHSTIRKEGNDLVVVYEDGSKKSAYQYK